MSSARGKQASDPVTEEERDQLVSVTGGLIWNSLWGFQSPDLHQGRARGGFDLREQDDQACLRGPEGWPGLQARAVLARRTGEGY